MADNQKQEISPGTNALWRNGFIVLSIAIVVILISISILLEIGRQIALVIFWSMASVPWFFAFILLLVASCLIGGWFSMIVIFGCTNPVHKSHYWRWVFDGFLIFLFVTMDVFQFASLQILFNLPVPSLDVLSLALISANVINLAVAFAIAGLSAVMWFKWLKPLTKL